MTVELGEQVAEQIMGWTRPVNKLPRGDWLPEAPVTTRARLCHRQSGTSVSPDEYRADKWWQAPDGTYHEHPPAYSTDWAAFGELLEKLRSVTGDVPSPISLLISARLARARVYEGLADNHDIRVALCQAALKAKEVPSDGT